MAKMNDDTTKSIIRRNTPITHCRPAHGTVRKRHRTLTVTRNQEDNKSKATSSTHPCKDDSKTRKDTR